MRAQEEFTKGHLRMDLNYKLHMNKQRNYEDRIQDSGNGMSKDLSFGGNYKHTDMARA